MTLMRSTVPLRLLLAGGYSASSAIRSLKSQEQSHSFRNILHHCISGGSSRLSIKIYAFRGIKARRYWREEHRRKIPLPLQILGLVGSSISTCITALGQPPYRDRKYFDLLHLLSPRWSWSSLFGRLLDTTPVYVHLIHSLVGILHACA